MTSNKKVIKDLHLQDESETPTKTSWWKYALTAGVISALGFLLVSFIPSEYKLVKIALVIGFAVFVLVITKNPVNRYMNGFYIVFFMGITANGIPFIKELLLKNNNMEINIIPHAPDYRVTLIMGLICIVFIVLDFKERNPKQQNYVPKKKNSGVTYKGNSTHNGDNNF